MDREEKTRLFRQIMWDYNIQPESIEAVFEGKQTHAGHYTRDTLFLKILESYSWFTILQLFPIREIKELLTSSTISKLRSKSLRDKYEFVQKRLQEIKIDIVNDVVHYIGAPAPFVYGKIDKPLNILSNKLTAIVSRDEPKDFFDIMSISLNYSFRWREVFNHAKQKAILNELDVEKRLHSFPIDLLQNADWVIHPLDIDAAAAALRQITDDFLLGEPNSLGADKPPIELALQNQPFQV